MANNRLTYFRSLINRQTHLHETLSEYLTQAETLIHVAASCREFASLSEDIINNYAWAVREILHKASKLNDQVLSELIRIRTKGTKHKFYHFYSPRGISVYRVVNIFLTIQWSNRNNHMIKKDFLKAVASKNDLSMAKVEQLLDTVFETITKALTKGDEIAFAGFGKFKVVKHAARKGRNPHTGAELKIPARKAEKFVVGKKLKETISKK